MRVALAGGKHWLARLGCGFLDFYFTEDCLEHFGRDGARTHHGRFADERDDGAFDAYGTGAAIDNACDAVGELGCNMFSGRGAYMLKEVCARGGQRES